MDISRNVLFVARHRGALGKATPTRWGSASLGEKLAALAVLAMMGSLAAILAIPVLAIASAFVG